MVSDDPRAQQRRECHRIGVRRHGVCKIFRHGRILGISAVLVVAGESRSGTQILLSHPAILAGSIGVPQPGDADSVSDLETRRALSQPINPADDLMTGNDWPISPWQFTFDHMEIRPADRTDFNANAEFILLRDRVGNFVPLQRARIDRRRTIEDHCMHDLIDRRIIRNQLWIEPRISLRG